MAKHHGIISLSGGLDDLIHYRTKYGNLTRRRGNISSERRKLSPGFAKARQSASEHSYASTMGKLIRRGALSVTGEKPPGDTNTRLVSAIRKLQKLDTANPKGLRRLHGESVRRLRGFEWTPDAPILPTLKTRYELKIDRDNGRVTYSIDDLDVAKMAAKYPNVTHVDLMLSVTAIDYEADWDVSNFDGAGGLSKEETKPMYLDLECDIPRDAGNLIVVGLALQMYQEVNGEMNKIRTGSGFVILDAVMDEVPVAVDG